MSMTASRKAHTEIIDWWTLLSESSQVARETAESVSTEIIGEAAEDAEAAAEDARTAAAGADAAAASISQAISDGIAAEVTARESADTAILESIAAEADRAATAEQANAAAIAAEADRATSAEQTNAAAIAVLNGTGAGSVSRAVSDGIASVIAGAPQSLDTLKEIADWIDGHADDAAAMNSAIRQNAGNIAAEESARQAADTALSEGKQAKALSSPVEFDGVTYTQLEQLLSAVASTANEVNGKAEDNTLNFAPAFSEVTSYAVGDYVTYNNILYRCTTAHTAGVWVAGHFTQVTVGGQLKVQDISSSITIGDGYASGKIYVFRDGNTVQVVFNSVQTTGYGKTICSGLPKPLYGSYFCVQADGDPQELGLASLMLYGSIESGSNTAGIGPSKVWDGFITYLTRD